MPISRIKVPVTPNRKTHLYLDCVEDFQIQQPFYMRRRYSELCRTHTGQRNKISFTAGVGWHLQSTLGTVFNLSEREDAQSLIYRLGSHLTVAPSWQEVQTNRLPSELGIESHMLAANYPTSSDTFVERQVSVGQDWNSGVLSQDQLAFPGPSEDEAIALDRVCVGNAMLQDNEVLGIRINLFHTGPTYIDTVARFYFCGPAGSGPDGFVGYGQYALSLRGHGYAVLWERGRDGINVLWRERFRFTYAAKSDPFGKAINLLVRPVPQDKNGGSAKIIFGHSTTTDYMSESSALGKDALTNLNARAQSDLHADIYNVPFLGAATIVQPVRVDVRRDLKARFQIAKDGYEASGTLRDDNFTLPFFPNSGSEILLGFDANLPSGCSITPMLYDARTRTALTLLRRDIGKNLAFFSPPTDPSHHDFYVEFTFEGPRSSTPTLQGYDITIPTLSSLVNNTEKETVAPVRWQIWGQDVDPAHERAEVMLKDVTNSAAVLDLRAGMPVRLETEYEADPSKRCVLFRGYVDKCISIRRGAPNQRNGDTIFPAVDWKERNVVAVGAWDRLYQSFLSMMVNYNAPRPGEPVNPTTKSFMPWKATDAIQNILLIAGFPLSMIGIGKGGAAPATDLQVRCFAVNNDYMDLQADPTTRAGDLAEKIAELYLGATLYFDANAGTMGVWKLILPKRAPYKNVAAYVTGAAAGKLPHYLSSYPATVDGDRSIPTGFIRKGTGRTWVEPPEVNMLTVTGSGSLTSLTSDANRTTTVFNEKSFNFLPGQTTADPSHPDYLGRLVWGLIVSHSLSTKESVQWAARRAFEVAGYAHKMVSFQAPLLLLDNEDEEGRKRIHRPYDPILIDGNQFLVRSCNPCASKDELQWAMIEAEAPRF